MAIIKSLFNEVVARLANVGIKGKTRTLHFEPVRKGKTFVQRPCKHCGCKSAVVFRGFEDKAAYVLWCPRCHKFSYPVPNKDNRVGETPDDKCKGNTVKGARCKHRAMANGYCGQHQDQAPTAGPAYEGQGRAVKHLQETRV